VERILGSVPDGQSMAGLASGFARLSGLYTTIETGRENSTYIRQFPQPRVLQTPMYQNLAILCAIQLPSEDIVRIFGKDFKSSEAIIAASNTLLANFGRQNHKSEGAAVSPKEVVDDVKEQILAGKTWDGELRRFIALQYRGTILNGALLRLMGMVAGRMLQV
jgi:hypothetical protein